MYKYQNREEVPKEYKWDLTEYFKNDVEFNELLEITQKEIETLDKYKGCIKDANSTYEFLNKEMEILSNVELLYVYAMLKNDEVLGVKENIERLNLTLNLDNKLETKTSFFDEEIINLSESEYNNLYLECKSLEEYKSMLDRIYRKKEHILNENEENIISELMSSMNNYANISSNLLNSEHDYGKIELPDGNVTTITINNYGQLMKNPDRNIRKQIYTSFNSKLKEYAGTSANLLNSYVKGNNTYAKLHNFNSAWESKLFSLELDDKVFKTLVETVEKNTEPLKRYYRLRKQILNLEELRSYDLAVELISTTKEYTIEEAQELIRESLKPLGDNYIQKLDKTFKNRYIDYIGYKGKCSGGYSMPTRLKGSRVLLSFNSNLNSTSTIAHESGHNINQEFLIENNPLQYRLQPVLVAEVASLTNECLLSSYIVENGKSKEEKLLGLENMLRLIRGNLFAAVREGKIEQEMYDNIGKGGVLSKEYLGDLVEKSLKLYYGDTIVMDEFDRYDWITRSHYYYNFYLYSYAISISVAINVAKEIMNGNKEMLDNYMKFLSTGSYANPTEMFAILGINLTDADVYKNAINYFDELIGIYKEIYYDKEVSKE